MLKGTFAFVDLETTGGNPVSDRITEIAIVRVEDGEVTERYEQLLNPGQSIPEYIQRLTGITNDMVEHQPRFEAVADEVMALLEGAIFVAHNARFDHGFLRNAFKRCDQAIKGPVLCTVKLSRRLYPEHRRHNLDALIERHGLDCDARHRAMGDAWATYQFAVKASDETDANTFDTHIRALTKRASLPARLSEADIDAIPDSPGVYRFYDEREAPLYVGKSINLRTRVMSHFSADHSSQREMQMAQQTARIDWIDAAGELGALLKESQQVKELTPVYNRKLRQHRSLITIHWDGTPDSIPELVGHDRIDGGDFSGFFGLFRSKSQAKKALIGLADEHQLCHKKLGIEKNARGACFRAQIGKCNGVCCGREAELQHTLRMSDALAKLKLQSWPWTGAVGIRETHPEGWQEVHVVDNWCYVGSYRSEDALLDAALDRHKPAFDMDTYKLLVKYLMGRRQVEVISGCSPRSAADA